MCRPTWMEAGVTAVSCRYDNSACTWRHVSLKSPVTMKPFGYQQTAGGLYARDCYLYHSAITNSLLFWLRNLQWCRRVGEDSSMWQRGLGLVAGVAVSSTQLLKLWRTVPWCCSHAATSFWCEPMQWRAFNSSTTTPRVKKNMQLYSYTKLGSFDRFSKFFHC